MLRTLLLAGGALVAVPHPARAPDGGRAGGAQSSIVLSANNIFDVVARRHASFLKDYAPLAGRDLRVGLRVMF